MSETEPDSAGARRFSFRRTALQISGAVLLLLIVAAIIAYNQRENIARDYVSAELERLGVEASYDVEEIGIDREVLKNIVVGDPESPDARVKRLELYLDPVWGGVKIDRVKLEGLRLFGSYKNGVLSLGTLDPFLQSDSGQPPQLPDFRLSLVDARARLDTDYGVIGITANGDGNLRYGFKGNLAAISRQLDVEGCIITRPTLFGAVSIPGGAPRFDGPFRFASVSCTDQGLRTGQSDIQTKLTLARDFKTFTASTDAVLNTLRYGAMSAAQLTANTKIDFNGDSLKATTDARARNADIYGVQSGSTALNGDFSANPDFTAGRFDGDVRAARINAPDSEWRKLSAIARDTRETPFSALLDKFVRQTRAQSRNMTLRAPVGVRYDPDSTRLFVRNIRASNAKGERLAEAENIRIAFGKTGLRSAGGSFALRGKGLPQLSADFEALSVNSFRVKARMAQYRANDSALALPLLVIQKNGAGAYGFSGQARISGPLPGGYIRDLHIPLSGGWSSATGLRMYTGCESLRFAAFKYAGLRSDADSIRLCPNGGQYMLSQRGGEYIVSARLPDGQFAGYLGDTPIAVKASRLAFSLPGRIDADNLRITIGRETLTTITADNFTGMFGRDFTGSFTGADAGLSNVPLDITDGSGNLRFADAVLEVRADSWTLSDREQLDRFQPLVTRDTRLRLDGGIITATGTLREPKTNLEVVAVDIRHDLNRARGGADLDVAGIMFNDTLQPEMLTGLTLGVIANVQGEVRGKGRIDWDSGGVSSTGTFHTDDIDLAAAFGPVTALSGEIVFSDLLGLETAPGQIIRMAEVNPGISASDGVVRYQLLPEQRVKIEEGVWPFSGGTLYLEPTILDFSEEKNRNLVFRIEGMDAAKFLLKFDFENLTATGTFDGRLPMIFDQNGGRIEGGRLDVRNAGGTLAYVGQLTYEDLSPIVNYAFDALKSLRYKELTIRMNGPLDGEIVTEINMSGISQGEGVRKGFIQNYITRELAKIPLEFNVTITAPFMQLITTGRSLYDTEYVLDPVAAGLIRGIELPAEPVKPNADKPALPEIRRENELGDEPTVQPLESENMP